MSDISVSVEDVSMMFNLSRKKEERFKEYFINLIKGELFFDEFWALQNISFNLRQGESIGFVGLNGSGKSTLLKLISGIMKPTKGKIVTKGSIAPLIELGGGFDRDLSAVENIYLTGAMHGHNKHFLRSKVDEILDFAELNEFANVPLRNYSSGMISRLGFAIATLVEADILIADEVLSVGDARFRKKCEDRMANLMKEGTTILFVSHSVEQVRKVCQKALWLEKGHMKMIGSSIDVTNAYSRFLAGK